MSTLKPQPDAGIYGPSTSASKLPSSYDDPSRIGTNLVPGASSRQPHNQDEADENNEDEQSQHERIVENRPTNSL
jgi:hypothetical protein